MSRLNLFRTALLLLIGFLVPLADGVGAQPVYELDPRLPVHPLDSVMEVLADSSGGLTFAAAATATGWRPLTEVRQAYSPRVQAYHLPLGVDAYFVRFRVRSRGPTQGWQLHLEDKLVGSTAWIRGNGRVEMQLYWGRRADQVPFRSATTGVDAPAGKRDLPGNRTLDRLRFELPVDTTVTALLRIKGNAFGFPPYLNASLRAPRFLHYHPFLPWPMAFNSFLLGVALIMLLTHALLFLYLRDRVYGWFALWLLLCTLTQGMTIGVDLRNFLPFHYENFRLIAWLLIPGSMLFTFWLFGRAYVNTPANHPRLDRYLLLLPLAMATVVVVQAVRVVLFDPPRPFTALAGHYEAIALFSVAGLVLGGTLASRKGDALARYFGVGAMVASVFTLLGGLWSLRLIRLPFDPYAVGVFSQIVVYAFGMAYRRQQIVRRAHREELAAQAARGEAERLRDLDEVKTRFFANISHEFRTPLTLIQAPLERARDRSRERPGQPPAEGGVALTEGEYELIRQNSDRLTELVEQLLELARLENGSVVLQLRRGDVIEHLRRLVAGFESLAEQRGVALVAHFPAGCPTAHYDADVLTKIVGNLLSNALKFTPVRGTVTVSVSCGPTYFTVEVVDTGPGMQAEDVEHVFERFFRAAGTEVSGSGIGLAMTKELVDVYGGTISVRSTVGKGSSFRVRLPHAPSELPQSSWIGETGEGGDTTPVDHSTPKHSGVTRLPSLREEKAPHRPLILLVEDNASLRAFIAELLEDGYRVLTAQDGHQGERMATEHLPDLVVSDVMMPGQDGYALCHALKTSPKTSHIPVILLTAKAGQEAALAGLMQGADDYLTKPFDAKELLLRVANTLEGRRRLWDHLRSKTVTLLPEVDELSLDDRFLQQVGATITEQLGNETLSVDTLARAVGFSNSQLTRKLRALVGKTPNQLITEMRLAEAHRQLTGRQGSVSEIAYRVGYANPSYFSRRFREQYGCSPSAVLEGAGTQVQGE